MKMTLLDYMRSLNPYAPIPPEALTAGELVEILEELHELRARQCNCNAFVDWAERKGYTDGNCRQ